MSSEMGSMSFSLSCWGDEGREPYRLDEARLPGGDEFTLGLKRFFSDGRPWFKADGVGYVLARRDAGDE